MRAMVVEVSLEIEQLVFEICHCPEKRVIQIVVVAYSPVAVLRDVKRHPLAENRKAPWTQDRRDCSKVD
jgi:hypothetical protein